MLKKIQFLCGILPLFFIIIAWSPRQSATYKKSSLPLPSKSNSLQKIRIVLAQQVREVQISSPDAFDIWDSEGHLLESGASITDTMLRASGTGIQWGSHIFQRSPLVILSQGEGIRVGTHVYRHGLRVWREGAASITVVNEIPIEEYLKGVLPIEANPAWDPEALKAQAVVSRTYALFKAIENQEASYDLSKDVLSQVYAGKRVEKPQTNQAIEATRGQILIYHGEIFPAYFHSTCGGRTTRPEYQWDYEGHPVLRGVACQFCRESKHYRWQETFTFKEIQTKLKEHGFTIGTLRRISPLRRDDSGRVTQFLIEHEGRKLPMRANDFRLWVDAQRLKSTLITEIESGNEAITFRGRGWGHGVGLCQYGVKKLGELGYSYREILEFYYPGSDLTTLGKASEDLKSETGLGEKIRSVFSFFE
ncbi:MAG: SpoIID/LytB domain-containing protein [Candidatus Omnitrophica bacterium]|nr:SpoIID/LytB domain-containing protein [Candidatus Omnitrophota bacterium]